jgi:hypothetical protein
MSVQRAILLFLFSNSFFARTPQPFSLERHMEQEPVNLCKYCVHENQESDKTVYVCGSCWRWTKTGRDKFETAEMIGKAFRDRQIQTELDLKLAKSINLTR